MQTEVKVEVNRSIKHAKNNGLYRKYIKRPMDFVLSLVAIIILSPLLGIIAFLVLINMGRPVIFKQQRPGYKEKIFIIYKFRTMTDKRDKNGKLLPDNERLTRLGKFLRNTSLDELPELFNILKGDMSIVGPRPQLIKDMVFMIPQQRKRHSVLPGLTGWAQINGRNDITWEEKLALDLEYLNSITFKNDCGIIIKTIMKVFKCEDISSKGMDTAEDLGDYLLRTKRISIYEYENLQTKQKDVVELK